MDNRRFFLAILLSLAVVVAWQILFPADVSRRLPAPRPVQQVGEPVATPAGGAAAPADREGEAVVPPQVVVPHAEEVAASAEQRVILAGPGRRVVLTNRGAQLLSFTIGGPRKEILELVRSRRAGPFPYALTGRDLRPLPLDEALFAVAKQGDANAVTFRYNGPAGVAEKRFSLDARGLLHVEVQASGKGWGIFLGPGIRNPTADELSSRYEQRDAVIKQGAELKVWKPEGTSAVQTVAATGLAWAGLEDTYFLSAQVPESGLGRVVLAPVLVQPGRDGSRFFPVPATELTGEQKDLHREYALLFEPQADRLSLVSFWGAKRIEDLSALPYGLDEAVQLGWFRPLVLPLLFGLHWIHDHVVANYGWAIVLMTALIKLLLLPLTHRSTVSMRKMQKLNPKMQAIRDRYRPKLKDKQGRPNLEMQRKMNEDVMGLYKAEGVNPAGGCLPMVLQMPFFFAFYRLLNTSVDLHHAPWILWIQDLSAKDPYLVLPLIMGGTQFLQTYLTPQAGDPTQRRLFMLMPLFMLIFFLPAPSGLVLYWLTNNVLTIIQQGVYNRLWKNET